MLTKIFIGYRIIENENISIYVSTNICVNKKIDHKIIVYNKQLNTSSIIYYDDIDELENYILFYRQKYG